MSRVKKTRADLVKLKAGEVLIERDTTDSTCQVCNSPGESRVVISKIKAFTLCEFCLRRLYTQSSQRLAQVKRGP